jgi:hypothetical protein
VLSSCSSSSQVAVVAKQPQLEQVKFVGQRVCGNFSTTFQQFSFNCPPLPIVDGSGWQLTPLMTPEISNPAKSHPNRQVNMVVAGPTLSSLDIEFAFVDQRPNQPIAQVDPSRLDELVDVGLSKQAGVSVTDDGTTRRWTVSVVVSTCAEFRQVQFFDRGSSGPRSNPLAVYLIRSPQELYCDSGQHVPLPGMAGSAGPGDPVSQSSAACPNGGAQQSFNVCENCAAGHPPQMNVFVGYSACSWNDVLNAFGYQPGSTKSQQCTITQAGRASCEGP